MPFSQHTALLRVRRQRARCRARVHAPAPLGSHPSLQAARRGPLRLLRGARRPRTGLEGGWPCGLQGALRRRISCTATCGSARSGRCGPPWTRWALSWLRGGDIVDAERHKLGATQRSHRTAAASGPSLRGAGFGLMPSQLALAAVHGLRARPAVARTAREQRCLGGQLGSNALDAPALRQATGRVVRSDRRQRVGQSLDRLAFLTLAAAGIAILAARRSRWPRSLSGLWPLLVVLVYMLVSTLWSDITLIAIRRWTREAIVLVMALVVVSEARPDKAVESILRRSAYILIPFSLMLIKYYPRLGVDYGRWSGEQMWIGVTVHKNTLRPPLPGQCLLSPVGPVRAWSRSRAGDWQGVHRTALQELGRRLHPAAALYLPPGRRELVLGHVGWDPSAGCLVFVTLLGSGDMVGPSPRRSVPRRAVRSSGMACLPHCSAVRHSVPSARCSVDLKRSPVAPIRGRSWCRS